MEDGERRRPQERVIDEDDLFDEDTFPYVDVAQRVASYTLEVVGAPLHL